MSELPPLPEGVIEVVGEGAPPNTPGFLRLAHPKLVVSKPGGARSEPFTYDVVERDALDAVVIAAHFRDAGGARRVYLRVCLRPPLALRPAESRPVPEGPTLGALWELPAGLIEKSERGEAGLRAAAARELREELGFAVAPEALAPLGPSAFPAPGMVGERQFYFHVEVDPATREAPSEDGSALEEGGAVAHVALEAALAMAREGRLEDAKTELALRRLAEL